MKKKFNIYIITFLFIYIYFPPLISINLIHLLTLFSFFNIIRFYKSKYIKIIIGIYFKNIIIPITIAIFYLICVILISNNNFISLYPYLIIIIEIPVCVLYICLYFIKNKYNIYDVLNMLLIVGSIQGIIAILCFFMPSFKDMIINIFVKSQNRLNESGEIIYLLGNVRLNGLSSNLTFTTPVVQTLLGLISLYLTLNKNYKYVLLFPILVFSAIINARSTFIVLIYGILILIFISVKKPKSILKLIFILIIFFTAIPIFTALIKNSSELVYKWIFAGFDEIVKLLQGDNVGYFQTASNYFVRLPDSVHIIFGTGRRIFGLGLGLGSDIGYINDVWLGGIIFTSIVYIAIITFYIKVYNNPNKVGKFISLLFVFTFIILNIKGTIISNNDFINLSFLLTTVFILDKKCKCFTVKD